MSPSIDIMVPKTDPDAEAKLAAANQADLNRYADELNNLAWRAIAAGKDRVEVTTRWVEEVAGVIDTYAKPNTEVEELVDHWNGLVNYVYTLDASYTMVPELLEKATDFTGQIIESQAAAEDETIDMEDVESHDACLVYACEVSQSPELATFIFMDDCDLLFEGAAVRTLSVSDIRSADPVLLEAFWSILPDIKSAINNKQEAICLPPEILTGVLWPLNRFFTYEHGAEELIKQVADLEMGVTVQESEIAHYVEVLKRTAGLLRAFTGKPALLAEAGIDGNELREWLVAVEKLRCPAEVRLQNTNLVLM